jgi:myo-inositol-1(or 4)-monophosphatase
MEGLDWLGFCRAATARIEVELAQRPSRADREAVVARGAGGDDTTEIDQVAEDIVVSELERLAAGGASFTLISEELGERRFGDAESDWRVVVDPIDGSLNAKRGLPLYALSIAVADGPAMGDVTLGYVFDLAGGEEWIARRGGGATVDGVALGSSRPLERLQLVALEATRPEHLAPAAAAMAGVTERVRVLGSLALALCHLADGRLDAVASLRPRGVRSIDIAAAQLVVREAGAAMALPDAPGPFAAAPLDLVGRSRMVAAGDDRVLALVAGLLGIGSDAGRPEHPG